MFQHKSAKGVYEMKKVVSIILTMCLLLSTLCFTVSAAATTDWTSGVTVTETGVTGSEKYYTMEKGVATLNAAELSGDHGLTMTVPYTAGYSIYSGNRDIIDISWEMAVDTTFATQQATVQVHTGGQKIQFYVYPNIGRITVYNGNADGSANLYYDNLPLTTGMHTYRVIGKKDNHHLFLDGVYVGQVRGADLSYTGRAHKVLFMVTSYNTSANDEVKLQVSDFSSNPITSFVDWASEATVTETGTQMGSFTRSFSEIELSVPKNETSHGGASGLNLFHEYDVQYSTGVNRDIVDLGWSMTVTEQTSKEQYISVKVLTGRMAHTLYIYPLKDCITTSNGSYFYVKLGLNTLNTFKIKGDAYNHYLYLNGNLVGELKSNREEATPSITIGINNGTTSQNFAQTVKISCFESIVPVSNTFLDAYGKNASRFHNDFESEDYSDWITAEENEWTVQNGALTTNLTATQFSTESYKRVYKRVTFADDFNYSMRMRHTSENFMGYISFVMPNIKVMNQILPNIKSLTLRKDRDMWICNGETAVYKDPGREEWFNIDIKTYNNCEGAEIFINGELLMDVPIIVSEGISSYQYGIILTSTATEQLCKYSNIEVDSVTFEPRYNNIEIAGIENGAAFTEGTAINVTSTFDGLYPPDSIQYLINGIAVAQGSASNSYSATISGLSAGEYEISAKSADGEQSISKSFSVTRSLTGGITAQRSNSGYTLSTNISGSAIQVSEVEYLIDGVSVGSSTTSPYSVTVSDVSNKQHTVVAICKNAYGLKLVEYTDVLNVDLTKTSEHFANDISYSVSGTSGNATYDFSNGSYRLYLQHTPNGVTYLTDKGEKTYHLGTGKYEIFTNGAFANVYRNGQLAFSLVMPANDSVSKNITNSGMTISNESVEIAKDQNTYFAKDTISSGKHIYNVPDMPYIYNFNFEAQKTDEMSIVINDAYFRTNLEIKDGGIYAWNYMDGKTLPSMQRLCSVPDISGDIRYRINTEAGMTRIYANEQFLSTFRSARSIGGKSIAIQLFDSSSIKNVELNDNNDWALYSDNFDGAGEFPSEEFWIKGYDLTFDSAKGIVLDGTEAAEINVSAGTHTLSADVTIESLTNGFWFLIDHAATDVYTKVGYNKANGQFEMVDRNDGVDTTTFTQSGSLPIGETFNFKLEAVQNDDVKEIKVYIDNTLAFECEKVLYKRGPVGFKVENGKASIDNVSYKGDARPVRGAKNSLLDGIVEPTWSASEYEGKLTFYSPSKGKAVSTDGGKTYTQEAFVEGDGFNVYQFIDKSGEPTNELISLVSGAHLRKTPNIVYDSEGNPYTNVNIYRSFDFGKTWTDEGFMIKVGTVLPNDVDVRKDGMIKNFGTRYNDLHQGKSGRLYVTFGFLKDENDGSALLAYSDDKGKTWTFSETHLTNENTGLRLQEAMTTELANGVVRMYSRNDTGAIVYFDSLDGGKTFETTYHTTPFFAALNCFQIQTDPYDTNTMYACWSYDNVNQINGLQYPRTRPSLARSTDNGETWEFLGTYFEHLTGHSNTNLCLPITENHLFMNGWMGDSATTSADNNNHARVIAIDKDKLQGTKNFERVHMITNRSLETTIEVNSDKMLVINSADGTVWSSKELYQDMVNGRFISAEIAASYAGMKTSYNSDGTVSLTLGSTQKTFSGQNVTEHNGKKFISVDAFIEEFNLNSTESDGTIVIDSVGGFSSIRTNTARFSVDLFDAALNEREEELLVSVNAAATANNWEQMKTILTVTYADLMGLTEEDLADIEKVRTQEMFENLTKTTYTSVDAVKAAFNNELTKQRSEYSFVLDAVLSKAANGDNSRIENGTLIFDLSPTGSVVASQADLPVLNFINLDLSFDVQITKPFAANSDLYFETQTDHGRFQFIINSWRIRDRVNMKDYDFATTDNADKHNFRFVINWGKDSGEGSYHETLQVFVDGKYIASIQPGARSGNNKTRFSQYCGGVTPVLTYVSNFKNNTATDLALNDDNSATVIFHEALDNARLIWAAYDADNKMISYAISDGITTPAAYSIRRLSAPATFNAAGAAKVKIMLWKDIDTTFVPLSASVSR